MTSRRNRTINLPAPYLKRIWLDPARITNREAYPFCLPLLRDDFELSFDRSITIIVGENGTGKSTVLEGIAVLAGYDEAGGGKGYMPVDHSQAIEAMGGQLSKALRASWLPKITSGWFFRAETFFSVARYLDQAALEEPEPERGPDFLSHSHGEGFLRFFRERCQKQGIYIFDEPESALSPARQIEFLKLMRMMEQSGHCQIIMATHSPMLMAYPNARLLKLCANFATTRTGSSRRRWGSEGDVGRVERSEPRHFRRSGFDPLNPTTRLITVIISIGVSLCPTS